MATRLAKFFLARLSTLGVTFFLTYIFVTTFPDIIGQFVEQNIDRVNTVETILASNSDHHFKLHFRSKIYILKGQLTTLRIQVAFVTF